MRARLSLRCSLLRLWVEEDGSITALARGISGQKAQLCRVRPPYRRFSRVELHRQVEGPLIVKWNGNYLIGGRKVPNEAGPRTALYWLVDQTLHEIAVLPSGGDNSYPGFVQLDDRRGLLSYYSSHEGDGDPKTRAAIYLVQLELESRVQPAGAMREIQDP